MRRRPNKLHRMVNVWLFVKAVFIHWYTLVGGCVLIVLLGLVERWRGIPVPNIVYWGAIIILVFVACYQAWLTEHEIAEYYRGKLTAKLELVFDDKMPFVEYVQERGRVGKSGCWKVFRVGVKNVARLSYSESAWKWKILKLKNEPMKTYRFE